MHPNRPVAEAFKRFLEAKERGAHALEETGKPDPEIEHDVLQFVVDVLVAYRSHDNEDAYSGGVKEQFPHEIAVELEFALKLLLTGNLRAQWRVVLGRGTPAVAPLEQQDIDRAVRYVLLAKDKTISDHAPIKSVMECYGVARSTVQGWVRRTVIDVSSWYPDAGNRDKLAASMMQKGGQRYRQLGRSKKALEARAMK